MLRILRKRPAPVPIGALWQRTAADGSTYYAGRVTIDGAAVDVLLLPTLPAQETDAQGQPPAFAILADGADLRALEDRRRNG